MKIAKEKNLFLYLNSFDLTHRASGLIKELIEFDLETSLPQRKMTELGKIVSRIVSMDLVLRLGEKGFDKEMIDGSLVNLQQEIAGLLTVCAFDNRSALIEPDSEHPSWREFCC